MGIIAEPEPQWTSAGRPPSTLYYPILESCQGLVTFSTHRFPAGEHLEWDCRESEVSSPRARLAMGGIQVRPVLSQLKLE